MDMRNVIIGGVFLLFVLFVTGLIWLSGAGVGAGAGTETSLSFIILLAYAAGLSMIILPCTLPLAFIIVPMCAGKEYKKGLGMALLFGLGITITITLYGIAIAYVGQILGLGAATPIILVVAGLAAYIFGFSETGIYNIKMPFMAQILPPSIQQKGDYTRSFFLGLLLGNAGVGCPNPLFYVLLLYIAGTGDLFTGGLIGLVHGLGRATPILILSFLAILGLSSLNFITEKRFAIKKVTGWSLIIIGAFLITTGVLDLRGWWILQSPLNSVALGITIILIILPFIIGKIKENHKKSDSEKVISKKKKTKAIK